MALLQPATANYFGFLPFSGNGIEVQVNAYPVSSSEGQIAAGDLCILTSRNTVKSGSTASGTALAANVIGVAAQFFGANLGSTTITNNNKCLIYDSPNQLFTICDSSSGAVGSSGIGLSYFVSGSGVTGSTGVNATLGRSVMAISGAVQASSAGQVMIQFLHPCENNVYATGATGIANVRKWVVNLRTHQFVPINAVDLLTS
jgi:hypothetical protein